MKKNFNLGKIRMSVHENGFVKGFVKKRELTFNECRHIVKNLLGIDLPTMEDYEYKDEYEDYRTDLIEKVNGWISGDVEDDTIMEFAWDCSDDPIGAMNIIPIAVYLKKKGII